MILGFIGGVGFQELLLIAFVFIFLFGGKKIPEMMKGMGKGIRSFKEGMNEIETEISTDNIKNDQKKLTK